MGSFFIRRPIVAIVIALVIVIAGTAALLRLPTEQYPGIVPPEILITTTYPGADALTIEQSVATPIEQEMNGVDNMIYVKSVNANDGTLSMRVSFEVGTNVDMDQVLAQNRVGTATPKLPADVKQYGVTTKKSMGVPLLIFSLYSPDGRYDADFIANYVNINVKDELLRVPGVGEVKLFGAADYAMRIWVKPDRLANLGLTVGDLKAAIQKQNAVNPAGQVGGEPAPPGQELTYAVRAQGRLVSAEEFGEVVVRINADGSVVRLKDVAKIDLGAERYTQRARYNGKAASHVLVYQAPGSNALAVAEGLKKRMEEMGHRLPEGVEYKVSLDTSLPVVEGINEIVHTLFEAVVLVILVVFLFLQSWRATLIPLLTVPVSLVGCFLFFPMFGFSVNTLSLLGLVLAIGLVVDDAIVVVEAVEHHIEHGLTPKEATEKAMKEVSGPVVAIALVLSAVFVPVAFLGGITGRLYQQFALTIAFSMMLSALNALTLSPALAAMLLKPKKKTGGLLQKFYAGFNKAFDKATAGYVRITGGLIRKLVIAVAMFVAFSAGAGFLGKKVPGGFVPSEDQGYLFLNVQLPAPASLQRTDEVCKRIEDILAQTHGVEAYDSVVGYSILADSSASYNAFFFLQLEEWGKRPGLDAKTVVHHINAELKKMPEANAFAFEPPAIPGLGNAGGLSMMIQDRAGQTPEDLEKTTAAFIEAAKKRPEIGNAVTMYSARVPQLYVKVDRDKMMKQGVQPDELYGALQAFMGGSYINDFNRFGRLWKVYIAAEPEYRRRAEELQNFFVRNKNGKMVPLSTMVSVDPVNGPENLVRFNLFRSAEVIAQPAPGVSTGQAMAALEQVAAESLPKEYGYAWYSVAYQEKKAPPAAPVFALSILLVFLILAAQYESWSLPFSVLLVVPVGVLGAFGGLLMRHIAFDVFGQIGLIMLIGLSAKNAILIVEFAKMEHEENGKPVVEAALSAAKLRLRPILMTAFAFILGCVPLIRAQGAGAASRQGIGTVIVFGALLATLVGIFLTPALYVLVEKLVEKLGGKKKPPSREGGGAAKGEEAKHDGPAAEAPAHAEVAS